MTVTKPGRARLARLAWSVPAVAVVLLASAGCGPAGAQGVASPASQQPGAGRAQHSAQVAMVGAGTTAGTTTGNSGPKGPSSSGQPPEPQASLCDAYQGAVHRQCLETVLRARPSDRNGGGSSK